MLHVKAYHTTHLSHTLSRPPFTHTLLTALFSRE